MNHFSRNLQTGLTGNKNDATPVFLFHRHKVVAAQPNAAHHIHVEELPPVVIGNLVESLRLEDTQIVNENVDCWESGYDIVGTLFSTKVRRDPKSGAADSHRVRDPVFSAAIDDNVHAFRYQTCRDREPDTRRRSCDQRRLTVELKIHVYGKCTCKSRNPSSRVAAGLCQVAEPIRM